MYIKNCSEFKAAENSAAQAADDVALTAGIAASILAD